MRSTSGTNEKSCSRAVVQSCGRLFAGFEVFHEKADAVDQVLAFLSS